jgi:hypothetical protein
LQIASRPLAVVPKADWTLPVTSAKERKIREEEFEAMLRATPEQRYRHFIKRSTAWKEAWLLADEAGYLQVADANENEALAVWPHPRYARAYIGTGENLEPERIPLTIWLKKVLPKLAASGGCVAIMPVLGQPAALVDAKKLRSDTAAEIDLYY